jgi:serralysin
MSSTLTGLAPSVTFAEDTVNATPQLLDGDVAFTASGSLAGGRLVVGGLLAEDRVSILHQGTGAGQIGVSDTAISYGGVAIGTASGGQGSAFTVTFNSAVTGAAVDALIQRLAYANVSDAPTATRTLTLDVVDANGVRVNAPLVPAFTAVIFSDSPFNGIDVGTFSTPSFVDLDGDGRLDFVSGRGDVTLRVWRNTGSATAPAFTELTGSANPLPFFGSENGAPSFVDLDGDGRLDLVAGGYFGTLRAFRNTGSAAAPAFTALTDSANPFNGIDVGNRSTPSFVDLDGDGRLDLVSGASDGTLRAWRNTGSAGASAFTELTGSANPFNGIDVGDRSTPSFVDLNGDGRLDLVSGNYSGTLRAWRNTGSAGAPAFTELTSSANPFRGINVGSSSTPSFIDLDGDGRLDLVSGASNGTLLAWRNTTPLPSITVSVTTQNDAPSIASDGTASFAENGSGTVYQAAGSDPDAGTTLNWTLGGADAALFNISSSGAVTFRTAPNFESPADTGGNNVYDITVTASDGTLSSSLNVAITVTNVNEAPSVTFGATASFAENGTGIAYQAVGSDPEGTTLSWSLSGADADLFSISSTGAVTFRAAPNFEAPADAGSNNVYEIIVTASDGTLSTSQNVAITVTNVNEAPSVTSGGTASFAENGTGIAYPAVGSDPESATLTWSLSGTDQAMFNINATTGAVTFRATPNFEAPADAGGNNVYDIIVTASDSALTASQNVAITVTNVNEAPSVTSGTTASLAENGMGTAYQAVGSDPDAGTTLIWTLVGADAGLFNISSTGAVTFRAAPNFEAPTDAGGNNVYDIIVTASDGALTASRNVAITVTDMPGATQNGTAGPDALTMGLGADDARLSGLGGNDTLTGGSGRDLLDGGGGDDVFVMSDTLDLIIETAGGGADTIITSVSMTMPDHVETLQIAAGISGITITGGAGNDMLIGNGLSNNFNGGAGDDVILMGNVTLADIHALFAT